MIQASFPAMGTTVDVVVADSDGLDATIELFSRLEQRLSRFLDESELSIVNAARDTEVEVSPVLAEVLSVAAVLRGRTGGLVDPAAGGAVAAWGYDRTFEDVVDLDAAPAAAVCPDWEIEATTLRRRPGTILDLGGIAKGWAADVAVESGRSMVVSAGGDVRSSLPGARVDIADPWGDVALTVVLGQGALATSSVTRRRWSAGGRAAHHLIDPRSGSPASTPVLSASASCGSAAEAEAAAKAVLLLGADGLAWADEQQWIESAMVVWDTGSVFATKGWVAA